MRMANTQPGISEPPLLEGNRIISKGKIEIKALRARGSRPTITAGSNVYIFEFNIG